MVGRETVLHSVIVGIDEAFGYLDAAQLVPDVQVAPVIPENAAEARLLVGERISHLLRPHRPSLNEEGLAHFIETSWEDMRGAFDDPDAVLVRISVPRDGNVYSRLDALALLAREHATPIFIPDGVDLDG